MARHGIAITSSQPTPLCPHLIYTARGDNCPNLLFCPEHTEIVVIAIIVDWAGMKSDTRGKGIEID